MTSKVIVTKSEIDKSGQSALNDSQINLIIAKTPKKFVYTRPARGGGTWNYVSGSYVKKVLNLAFGFMWSFEIMEYKYDLGIKQALVMGKLTVNLKDGGKIIKTQFGRADLKFKSVWNPETRKKEPTDETLDVGNDLKAAATDALKKCASELGVASDIYGANEFMEVQVIEDSDEAKADAIKKGLSSDLLTNEEREFMVKIIDEENTSEYNKAINVLNRATKKSK